MSSIEIRPATESDAVDSVIRAAFGEEGHAVAEVWAAVCAGDLWQTALVAVRDAAVIGHVGLSAAWLDARRELVGIHVLSPLSVLPEHQGSGVGTRLLAAAVTTSAATGAPLLVLEGSPAYYGARGFRAAAELGIEPVSRRIPAAASQVVAHAAHEPWMSGRIVYPDVWWRADIVGLRDPFLAELEGDAATQA